MPLIFGVLKDELNGVCCTSCHLAQGTGGGEVQFQVTLQGVTVSNTQPQIFPRQLINRDPDRLGFFPGKKKKEILPVFEWKGLMLITLGSGEILVSGRLAT